MTHPWHDLKPGNIPEEVEAFIEVPMNSKIKYELDKDSGFIRVDRILFSAVHYPGDYGLIPQTLSEDGDPLDIIVIADMPVHPGVILSARPIGLIEMIDGDERDEKIIAVHTEDPRYKEYKDLDDVAPHVIDEIRHFFETYKALEKKSVRIQSLKGAAEAKKIIMEAAEMYKQKFGKKE